MIVEKWSIRDTPNEYFSKVNHWFIQGVYSITAPYGNKLKFSCFSIFILKGKGHLSQPSFHNTIIARFLELHILKWYNLQSGPFTYLKILDSTIDDERFDFLK